MVRFSCFHAHVNSPKTKKTAQPSFESMHKTLEDSCQLQASKDLPKAASLNLLQPKMQGNAQIHDTAEPATSFSSVDHAWKSEEIKGKFNLHQTGRIQKSLSLGSGLCQEGRVLGESNTEDESDQGFSSDSHDENRLVLPKSSKHLPSQYQNASSESSKHLPSQYQNASRSESVQVSSDHVNNLSIFSIGDPQYSEKEGNENSGSPVSGEGANDDSGHVPCTAPLITKSSSTPNFVASASTSGGRSPFKYLTSASRSSEDLHILEMWQQEVSVRQVNTDFQHEEERDDSIQKPGKLNFENSNDEVYDSYSYSALAKDWIVPVTDEVNSGKNYQGESSVQHWDEVPNKDFKIKRIEEWVNDLQHCSPMEESHELFHSNSNDHVKKESTVLNGLTAAKADVNATPSMEAAKRYISSLSASATTAQLANHGLVVIPFLSAFVSMRVLNLSGNAIVRITAGALPRGLHMLNLSKNNISTIEGLRDLTRLRVLDLSYNRIFRIGHGLASCSSLKELYLAGNRISEVEGLHRLLKLTVLDLRFNKISTAKCLGQLAANYNSLQAISLEGNPAQKNVGDEQLKKHLQGLLPHLAYLNRQPIKVSTLKDAADRSVRLGISSHQFDRGLRSDHKASRKSSHVSGLRPSSSSNHARKYQPVVSPKQSRGRHGRLPPAPSGVRTANNHRQHYLDFGSKLLNLRSELSMRRTRSEGTLAAL